MAKTTPDESLPEALRRLPVGETVARVKRLDLKTATPAKVNGTMRMMRDTASSAISRASDKGRSYHRDSTVTLDENHNPLITILITRTA